jgi:hypothetical protein
MATETITPTRNHVFFTGYRFASEFYAGAALGSFNSWMRLLTGSLAAFGLVWFIYPRVQAD